MASSKKFNSDAQMERRAAMFMERAYSQAQARILIDRPDIRSLLGYLEDVSNEIESALGLVEPNPYFRMTLHLLRGHLEGRLITQSSLIGASRVPYATAIRRLKDMTDSGLIEYRARTKTGKSFSLHPSGKMLNQWAQLPGRLRRISTGAFSCGEVAAREYFYGDSYMAAKSIPPLQVLPEPIKLSGGLRVLVHGDPTFMVMDNLKRQFEQCVGTMIHQRAFSIDRLRDEALLNAVRKSSRYDIIAVDLPWIGEFVDKQVLMPLDQAMDLSRLDPSDFHTAGWQAIHWGGRPYGIPAQTTPELLFYRTDFFAEAGLSPPENTDELIEVAARLHDPRKGRYGVAWNAARGTALGHTFLMTMADFGQPVVDLARNAGGFDTSRLAERTYRAMIDSEAGLRAAEFLMQLLKYSPPEILSMSWYERIRPYASGKIAMAYGYTLLAPYFELDPSSPAAGHTGYLPHPPVPGGSPVAPVGGYALGIPANIAPDRLNSAVEALIVFTSPQAQKMYVQNGSRTNARYSVASDPEIRRVSPIFEAVEAMSWRDELQFWPRPPIPEISDIIQICGEVFHDMLRGSITPREALKKAQARADAAISQYRSQ